jgi:hypothetical protein
MGGERNPPRDMEPSDDRPTELARRVALLSAQRPARATKCVATPTLPAKRLSPMRVKAQANG